MLTMPVATAIRSVAASIDSASSRSAARRAADPDRAVAEPLDLGGQLGPQPGRRPPHPVPAEFHRHGLGQPAAAAAHSAPRSPARARACPRRRCDHSPRVGAVSTGDAGAGGAAADAAAGAGGRPAGAAPRRATGHRGGGRRGRGGRDQRRGGAGRARGGASPCWRRRRPSAAGSGAWPHTLPGRHRAGGRARLPRLLPALLHLARGAPPDRPRAGVPAPGRRLPGDLPQLAAGGPDRAAGRARR